MTEEQFEEMLDRLDDLEERVRLLEITVDTGSDELFIVGDLLEDDEIDILD